MRVTAPNVAAWVRPRGADMRRAHTTPGSLAYQRAPPRLPPAPKQQVTTTNQCIELPKRKKTSFRKRRVAMRRTLRRRDSRAPCPACPRLPTTRTPRRPACRCPPAPPTRRPDPAARHPSSSDLTSSLHVEHNQKLPSKLPYKMNTWPMQLPGCDRRPMQPQPDRSPCATGRRRARFTALLLTTLPFSCHPK